MKAIPGEKSPRETSRIAIVRLGAVGDVLRVLPCLVRLRQHFPRAHLSWVVEDACASLLEGAPQLDQAVVIPRGRWKRGVRAAPRRVLGEVRAFASRLRRLPPFDLIFDFHGNFRSSLVLSRLRGKKLGFGRGFCKELSWFWLDVGVEPSCGFDGHKLEWNAELLRAGGVPAEDLLDSGLVVPGALRSEALDRWVAGNVEPRRPLVAFHPGVSRFALFKRWPAARFAALGDLLFERLEAQILLSWGPGELEIAREVAENMRHPSLLAPRTDSLLHLLQVLEAADVLVAADTGPLHLAAAAALPVVGLFGPKDPGKYGPLSAGGVRIVRQGLDCSPCGRRSCARPICMETLPEGRVATAVEDLLRERQRALGPVSRG